MGIYASLMIASGVAFVIFIICLVTHDYTKDEKGKDIEDKIDDYLLR